MKYLISIFSLLLVVSCSTAQQYSTSNKKAIKLFEEALQAPNTLDPSTNRPNYKKGLELMNQAIAKDPNFWEAELTAGEFAEYLGDNKTAIQHYKKALQINPNHSPSGATYYYLANLQFNTGEYNDCIQNIDLFLRNRAANPDLQAKAVLLRQNCEFAVSSLNNPANFTPINLGKGVNTADPEYFPTITVDGKTLLFTRRIKDERVPTYKMQEDFYVSQLSDNNVWQTAVPMPTNINTVLNEGAPTISADGRELIFVACSDFSGDNNYGDNRNGKGSCDLFVTKKIGTHWSNPVNLPGNVNTSGWESQPSLSSDGKTLYFIKRVSRPGEQKNTDIFVTHLMSNGNWSTPERLSGIINTPYEEESVLIHPDGKTLYFASRGHVGMGGSDIFVSHLDDNGNWSVPENLGYPINTQFDENSLLVSADGEIAFFASDRTGGYGDLDIYYFEMPEKFRPTKTLYFEGVVYDATTRLPIPGKFQLIDIETGKEIVYSEADKVNGQFLVSLPVNKEYALNVTYPGYAYFSKNFNMKPTENQEAVHMDVPLYPLTAAPAVVLENVFFDLDKATLRPESFVELNKLADYLTANPNVKIEIGGHTDTRGDAVKNQVLSENRAKSVYDYLISRGIAANRLSYKGYGETKPVISDAEIAKLATEAEKEAAHQKNRRTEYKIVP